MSLLILGRDVVDMRDCKCPCDTRTNVRFISIHTSWGDCIDRDGEGGERGGVREPRRPTPNPSAARADLPQPKHSQQSG